MCKILRVSRHGYYAWQKRGCKARAKRDQRLLSRILKAHAKGRGAYGYRRVYAHLKKYGVTCSLGEVRRIMRKNNVFRKCKRRFVATTDSRHSLPVASNLLNRKFSVAAPNKVWVSDITYIWTKQGWLYLSVFIDLFHRKVVGWSMDTKITRKLLIEAFEMAFSRCYPKQGLIVHSDRGSQYASDDFRNKLEKLGYIQSMSRKGDCWDNAVAESFFGSLKSELIHKNMYTTIAEAKRNIFDYIEVFYNRERLHSTLGYLSPEEFERKHKQQVAA